MITGFLNLPWFLWAGLSLALVVVWVYVGPHTKMPPTPGFRFFMIRWGHASTWVFLAINFFLRGLNPSLNGVANIIALLGGLTYLLFMFMLFAANKKK